MVRYGWFRGVHKEKIKRLIHLLNDIKMKIIFTIMVQGILMNSMAQLKPVGSGVYHWNSLAVKTDGLRESRKIFEGTTPEFSYFEAHATTQQKGAPAQPPHAQDSAEELIIIKEGKLTCTIGDITRTLGPGSVLLIPPQAMQAFKNNGEGPVTYYVFKFRSKMPMDLKRSVSSGGALLLDRDSLVYTESNNKGGRKYFDRPTATCKNFEMHITYLKAKGPSHVPHQHVDTEIILMIDGHSEMMIDGQKYSAGPGDFYIAESGSLHGISNASDAPCSYFAFKWR